MTNKKIINTIYGGSCLVICTNNLLSDSKNIFHSFQLFIVLYKLWDYFLLLELPFKKQKTALRICMYDF